MTDPLVELLESRDLVAFVGAGGKTALMLGLAAELTARGVSVVVTTTTKMSAVEVGSLPSPLWSSAPNDIEAALAEPGPVLLLRSTEHGKVAGPPPGELDDVFRETGVRYLLVEADGAQRRPLKAPAPHEPVIPRAATLVVIVVGAQALGQPIGDVAHRPELVARLSGCTLDDPVTPDVVAGVVGHESGGLQGIPDGARVVVTITNVSGEDARSAVERIAALVTDRPRIERVVAIGPSGSPR